MAGGEFRLGTDSIYMAEYGQTDPPCTSIKYYITWLRFRRISGRVPSDSSGLVVKRRRKLGVKPALNSPVHAALVMRLMWNVTNRGVLSGDRIDTCHRFPWPPASLTSS